MCPDEAKAQVVLSTVHQSKGREFANVAVLDDFRNERLKLGTLANKPYFAEAAEPVRLLYVAITRAEKKLFVPMSVARRFDMSGELDRNGAPESQRVRMDVGNKMQPSDRGSDFWEESISTSAVSPVVQSRTDVSIVSAQPGTLRRSEARTRVRSNAGVPWLIVILSIIATAATLHHKGYISFF